MGEFLTQTLTDPLRRLGYDGLKHVGGARTNNVPHDVAILFDPQDLGQIGRRPDIRSFREVEPSDVREARAEAFRALEAATETADAYRALEDAAMAAERATPTPPVVERALTEPVEAPSMTAAERIQRESFNTLAAEHPDLDLTIEIDGAEVRGKPAELMARLDAEEAELTGTVDCLLGNEAVP